MRIFVRQSIWTILFSLFGVMLVVAQANECSALFEEALFAVEDHCDGTGRNQACYGFDQVSASFASDVSEDYFTQPADISPVADLETIRTAALDLESGVWGVALMNIQANLPNTLPGQNVTFMLMGDVEVENGVAAESAFVPSDGIEITVNSTAGANIRSGAGLNSNVIGGALLNEVLLTDGVSVDGDWFRVVDNDRVGWISRTVVDDSAAELADLPILTDDLVTPMQAFYLRTGIGQTSCEEIPEDILLVQGPENIEINITANGADIVIGSTVGLRVIEIDGQPFLESIAFSGEIKFMGQTLRPGQRSIACLGDAANRGGDDENDDLIVTCDASPPEQLDNFGEVWCSVEQLPADLMNYQVDILCPGETPVVVNNTNNDSGSEDISSSSNVEGVSCDSFSIIAPLQAVNSGNVNFVWTPVQGDNVQYQLVFYDFEGREVESFFTGNTSYLVNLGAETSTGGNFTWEVRVFQDGAYACVTPRSPQLVRTGELNPPIEGVFSATRSTCFSNGSTYETTVTWNNAPDTPVTIEWQETGGTTMTVTSNAASGSVRIQTSYLAYTFNFINVLAGGEIRSLGAC